MTKETKELPLIVSQGKLYATDKQIAEAIVKTNGKAATVQVEYQRIAASALVHLSKHKDIRVVRAMMEHFPESLRKNSMLKYLEVCGQVRVLTDADIEGGKFKGEAGDIVFDKSRKLHLNDALTLAWWKAKKQEEYRPYSLAAEVARIISIAEKRIKTADATKGDDIKPEQIAALKALPFVKKAA